MILLYRLLFIPALLLTLPFYVPRMLRRGGYAGHFAQRLGFWNGLPPKTAHGRRVWVHAVSVGEILALRPLIRRLREHDHRIEIVLTTTTSTAYALARREFFHDLVFLAYFPLDFWLFSRTAWKRVRPDACLLMEAEVWPEHLHQAKVRNVPVFLINARMSERSHWRWRKTPRCLRMVFSMMSRIVAASEADRDRFLDLGAPEDKVSVSGNLKLDFVPEPIFTEDQLARLRRELGFFLPDKTEAAPLVLAGASTWPGEEEMLLRVRKKLLLLGLSCKLLLVPRHAERGRVLRQILASSGVSVHFRTDGAAAGAVDVTVADTTGELVSLLQVADVVFVGKSMRPHQGGQNPIEAAALGKSVLFGPNMQNFQAVVQSMLENKAAIQVRNEGELSTWTAALLRDIHVRQEQGLRAKKWHESGRGATERTFAILQNVLDKDTH
ncbi:MAG TPA: 3-deoxy-D-manno-octulosonic acid transferase [Desulfonatronum sp.]|nr:3-deoxy-D-manno-octulosonic acid transferase [Desulfonatronum sp.]